MKFHLPTFFLASFLLMTFAGLQAQDLNNTPLQDTATTTQYTYTDYSSYTDTARVYETAVGIRLGSPLSVSAKHFLHQEGAVEVAVGFRNDDPFSYLHVSGAYQYHKPIGDVENLFYYVGAGVSIIRCKYTPEYEIPGEETGSFTSNYFGLQGYVGLDYAFKDIPLNLSADWIPTINLGENSPQQSFSGGFWALAARFIVK